MRIYSLIFPQFVHKTWHAIHTALCLAFFHFTRYLVDRSSADPVPLRGSHSCPAMVIAPTPAVLCAHSPTLMPVSCGAQPSRTAQVLDQKNNWSWGSGWGRRHRIGNPTPLGLGPALLGGGCYTKSSGPRSPGDGFGHVRNS